MRFCGRCKSERADAEFAAHAWCRQCTKEYNSQRRQDPAIRAKERDQLRTWISANKEKLSTMPSMQPEAVRSRWRKYAARNKEKIKQSAKHWKRANRDKIKAYPSMQREQRREVERRYWSNHREQVLAKNARRRALRIGASGSHTASEWLDLCRLYNWRCAYCNRGDCRLEKDHKIPLSRGGSDSITNIAPACISCNRKKRASTVDEFLAARA